MRFSGGTQLLKGFKSLKIEAYISPRQNRECGRNDKISSFEVYIKRISAHGGEINSHLALPDGGKSQIIQQ